MVWLIGHRQTKGAATDKPNLLPPRHVSTLPSSADQAHELTAGQLTSKLGVQVGAPRGGAAPGQLR